MNSPKEKGSSDMGLPKALYSIGWMFAPYQSQKPFDSHAAILSMMHPPKMMSSAMRFLLSYILIMFPLRQ